MNNYSMPALSEQEREELIKFLDFLVSGSAGQHKVIYQISLAALTAEPPVLQPVMFIDGNISPDDADKLAKVIQGFNGEDERPLAKMARIIRENPQPTNQCDMPLVPVKQEGEQ